MSGTFSQIYGPQLDQFTGGVFQVVSQSIGQAIVESIRKQLPRAKVQRGDSPMLLVSAALLKHNALEWPNDKEKLERGGSSLVRRMLQAREYKCRSKTLFIVVKKASDRAIDKSLLNEIRRAVGDPGPNRDGPDTEAAEDVNGPNPADPDGHDPFADPAPAQAFTRTSVDALDSVELETYNSPAGGWSWIHVMCFQ
ncbi:hypothetical protein BGW80DRAFT_1460666 [Lactifluus volemus]|nr:hypothetical protein BGW80DRAFT_1460666 [Lactifluus volemus]